MPFLANSAHSIAQRWSKRHRIGHLQPLTFWCDDVLATAKAMKAKGVEFALEPKTEVWWTMAIFREVDGKQFVLSNKLG
jgi:Glyoxalase/Bleomycin resistance protein/Dioxygenase superfamily